MRNDVARMCAECTAKLVQNLLYCIAKVVLS
jgi:hypothetical protein